MATKVPQTLLDPATIGGFLREFIFTSSGTYTRSADMNYAIAYVIGGGGGGGGCPATTTTNIAATAGGGAGGLAVKKILRAALGATETVTIGAAGAGGAIGVAGSSGGTSSFGSHCSATGGSGGSTMTAGTTATSTASTGGGVGSGGDSNITGAGAFGAVRFTANVMFWTSGGGGFLETNPDSFVGASVSNPQEGAASANGAPNSSRRGNGGSGQAAGIVQSGIVGAAGVAGLVVVREYS